MDIKDAAAPTGVVIPKIVMQTWKTNEVPEHWSSSPKAIKRLMPEWEYVLMTDEDNRAFVNEHFPDFLETYDSLEYNIMRADAIRYMWLYVKGGIYMDLDIQITKPLDDLFTEEGDVHVVSSANFGTYYTNAFMASKPGNKLWLRCLDEMSKPYKIWQVGKHLKVMGTTGPMMFTRVIERSKKLCSVRVLPRDFLASCSVCDLKPCDVHSGYARILEGSSWVESDTRLYIFCACHWRAIVGVVLVMIAVSFIIWHAKR